MNSRLVLSIAVGLFALSAVAATSSVRADGGYYGYGFPWFGYGNNGPAAYALGNIPAPPYFALHPPVYYSHPVARTYGTSPFACSCDCHHRKHESVRRVYVNPFIETLPREIPAKSEAKTTSHVAAVPARIANPYYKNAGAEAKLAVSVGQD
jgi:hypothetical protein